MKYCSSCGKELMDDAVVCPGCGCMQEGKAVQTQSNAKGFSFGWAALGFFIPLAGLVLFIIGKDSEPVKAKSAGIGALVGFIVNTLFSVVLGVFLGVIEVLFSEYMLYY